MTVLIAEDDPDQLAIRALLLRQCGFDVLEARSSEAALAAAEAEQPGCAVVDLRLPNEQDGLRLIRDLKKRLPDLFIYVMTGSRSRAGEAPVELALAEEIFSKGTSIAPLLQRLKNLRTKLQEV